MIQPSLGVNEIRPVASRGRTDRRRAFTLLELLAGMGVFMLLLALLFTAVNQTSTIWRRTQNQAGSYQSARFAFDLIARTLAQSTLNVYLGYDNPSSPTEYIRKSDLHFYVGDPPVGDFGQGNAIFFQAPMGWTGDSASEGLPHLLNAVGFYVSYGKDPGLPAMLRLLDRNRFRLMQFLDPSEELKVHSRTDRYGWFADPVVEAHSSMIAENVILLLFWPRLAPEEDPVGNSLTSNYGYDSRLPAAPAPQQITTHQQPPLVEVTMVAIDETSASRLPDSTSPPSVIAGALAGLFVSSSIASHESDLETLQDRLNTERIGYRVFRQTVALRESKWSK